MSLRTASLALLLVGASMAACTGAPATGEAIVTITTPTPPAPVIPALVPGSIRSSAGTFALMGATSIGFNVDPQGGKAPYTVTWNFGDGTAPLEGLATTHVFANTGNFNVVATVKDSQAPQKTETSSTTVRVRNVSGRWRVSFGGAMSAQNIDIVQNGPVILANMNETNDGLGSGTGAVSNPRQMSTTLTFPKGTDPYSATFVGTVSDDLMTWSGTAVGFMACPCSFTAQRAQPPAEP